MRKSILILLTWCCLVQSSRAELVVLRNHLIEGGSFGTVTAHLFRPVVNDADQMAFGVASGSTSLGTFGTGPYADQLWFSTDSSLELIGSATGNKTLVPLFPGGPLGRSAFGNRMGRYSINSQGQVSYAVNTGPNSPSGSLAVLNLWNAGTTNDLITGSDAQGKSFGQQGLDDAGNVYFSNGPLIYSANNSGVTTQSLLNSSTIATDAAGNLTAIRSGPGLSQLLSIPVASSEFPVSDLISAGLENFAMNDVGQAVFVSTDSATRADIYMTSTLVGGPVRIFDADSTNDSVTGISINNRGFVAVSYLNSSGASRILLLSPTGIPPIEVVSTGDTFLGQTITSNLNISVDALNNQNHLAITYSLASGDGVALLKVIPEMSSLGLVGLAVVAGLLFRRCSATSQKHRLPDLS